MTRELLITIRGDRMHITGPKLDADMANLIGLVNGDRIFSIGKSADELDDNDALKFEPTAAFIPIFDAGSFNPGFALVAIEYLSVKAGALPRFSLVKRPFDLTLEFPGYENLPRNVRDRFEVDTQFSLAIDQLRINGHQAGYTPSQKRLASTSHDLFGLAGLCLATAILLPLKDIGVYGAAYAKWPLLAVRFAAAVLAVLFAFVAIELSHLGWVRAMRDRMPHHLIRRILHRSSYSNLFFRKRYFAAAERILADSTQPDPNSVSKP